MLKFALTQQYYIPEKHANQENAPAEKAVKATELNWSMKGTHRRKAERTNNWNHNDHWMKDPTTREPA